jgi:hypothetical protein
MNCPSSVRKIVFLLEMSSSEGGGNEELIEELEGRSPDRPIYSDCC